jgi:hypothetical protein
MDNEADLRRAITERFESLVDDVYCIEWNAVQQELEKALAIASLTDLVHCYVNETLRLWGEGIGRKPDEVFPRYAHVATPDLWSEVEVTEGRNTKGDNCMVLRRKQG